MGGRPIILVNVLLCPADRVHTILNELAHHFFPALRLELTLVSHHYAYFEIKGRLFADSTILHTLAGETHCANCRVCTRVKRRNTKHLES